MGLIFPDHTEMIHETQKRPRVSLTLHVLAVGDYASDCPNELRPQRGVSNTWDSSLESQSVRWSRIVSLDRRNVGLGLIRR
jgi:hypothetical protein